MRRKRAAARAAKTGASAEEIAEIMRAPRRLKGRIVDVA
jgi:hypothetical protein